VGAAELPHPGDQERQHGADRRGQAGGAQVAVYFIRHTNLVERFRELYGGALRFAGNRSIVLDVRAPLPTEELRHCVAMALTYQLDKRPRKT
jgi:hypothetical protein